MNIFRTKSVEQSIADTEEPEHQLKKSLSAIDLVVFGIGVIIGTGIFVLTLVVTIFAGFIPLEALAELVNIGTLFAFMLVSIGVIILRRTRPDLPRAFRVPFSPVLPALAVLACLLLMLNLTGETWLRFAIWMLVGFVVYFAYSARHSRLAPGGNHTPVQDTATSRTESPRTA